jgi:hypothetical protein
MYIKEGVLLFVRAGLLVASAGDALVAQVQLPVVNLGDTNFEDALGGPGWLFEAFPTGLRQIRIASRLHSRRESEHKHPGNYELS